MEYKNRINSLRKALTKTDIDTAFISSKDNIRYYSGFTGTLAFLLITESKSIIITDSRYIVRAQEECPDYEIYQLKSGDNWIENSTNQIKSKVIGFEGNIVSFNMINQLKERSNNNLIWKDFSEQISKERVIKSESEVEKIEEAISISDRAFNTVSKKIKDGMTEKEIAWEIEKEMRILGADSISFDTIVASGINGAKPHHSPTDKNISNGEAITIDMGAKCNGYCSDLTRTIFIGEPNDEFKKIYNIVLRSQLISIETAKGGMTGEEIDKISRDIISDEGFGENFGHSLGHGVGLEIHENPGVGPNSKNEILSGMVYTIEPGIYIDGWGGIRIEDMVLMTDNGNRLLSHAEKGSY
tara:strand:- start:837 stop:1904 length:1068 start_codon:yes stop_codon:yes gene_type:complete